ncbi:MAG: hypothetical protein ACI3ZL_06340 [Candidatus Cryptobacteroides sp.]
MKKINNRFIERSMKFWTLFIGIGALVGALMMWTDPSGRMWLMDPLLDILRAKMPWPDIFFRTFIPSGFVLLAVNGLTQYTAAYLLFRKHRLAPYATLACGVILMGWIGVEWYLFGFYGICNAYFTFGFLEALTAVIAIARK